jgi:hypothetical protein
MGIVVLLFAPAERHTPRGPDHEGMSFMARHRILRGAVRDEVRRTILREAEARYRHEFMGAEERMLLWDRVLKLRRELELRSYTTLQ